MLPMPSDAPHHMLLPSQVVNAASAKVTGLKGLTYLDKSADPNNPAKKVEDREAVGFGTALVDSVYMNAPNTVDLQVGGLGCLMGWLLV